MSLYTCQPCHRSIHLGYAPGWNLYQYVNGMPWGSVDPMGLWGWGLPGQLMVWALQTEAGQGAIEVWERVTGDPYANHAKWQMQMANMASVNSARAARAGNAKLAQSIGMSFGLEMHNAQINEDFLTDGSFAAVDMITAAVPTGWAGGRVAGLISKTAAGKAVNALGTKIFRIAGYVTDPIKGAIIRIGKYMTDAVKAAAVRIGKAFRPADTTRVYRAVSEAEYQQILRTGRFEQGPNSLEGKWFADTYDSAKLHCPACFL